MQYVNRGLNKDDANLRTAYTFLSAKINSNVWYSHI